jgi:nitrate reductase delta subunit
MIIYKILSRLLDYPDAELVEHLPELRDLVEQEPGLNARERSALLAHIDHSASMPLLELQMEYVDTFDRVPEHDLHLTHHLFGDDKGRGPALVDLGEHYKAHGYTADPKELPDYLPLILEYCATLDETQARFFLADAGKVLEQLARNLESAGNRFAALIRFVESRGRLANAA